MAYIDYQKQKEDIQDNTFMITAALIERLIEASVTKDINFLASILSEIYDLVFMRMEEEQATEILEKLQGINERLYDENGLDDTEKTLIYDELTEIKRTLYKTLDSVGILFRARADLDSLVTRGGI